MVWEVWEVWECRILEWEWVHLTHISARPYTEGAWTLWWCTWCTTNKHQDYYRDILQRRWPSVRRYCDVFTNQQWTRKMITQNVKNFLYGVYVWMFDISKCYIRVFCMILYYEHCMIFYFTQINWYVYICCCCKLGRIIIFVTNLIDGNILWHFMMEKSDSTQFLWVFVSRVCRSPYYW
jgi:hypothetical protein